MIQTDWHYCQWHFDFLHLPTMRMKVSHSQPTPSPPTQNSAVINAPQWCQQQHLILTALSQQCTTTHCWQRPHLLSPLTPTSPLPAPPHLLMSHQMSSLLWKPFSNKLGKTYTRCWGCWCQKQWCQYLPSHHKQTSNQSLLHTSLQPQYPNKSLLISINRSITSWTMLPNTQCSCCCQWQHNNQTQ